MLLHSLPLRPLCCEDLLPSSMVTDLLGRTSSDEVLHPHLVRFMALFPVKSLNLCAGGPWGPGPLSCAFCGFDSVMTQNRGEGSFPCTATRWMAVQPKCKELPGSFGPASICLGKGLSEVAQATSGSHAASCILCLNASFVWAPSVADQKGTRCLYILLQSTCFRDHKVCGGNDSSENDL